MNLTTRLLVVCRLKKNAPMVPIINNHLKSAKACCCEINKNTYQNEMLLNTLDVAKNIPHI